MRRIVVTYGLIAGGVLAAMLLVVALFQDRIGFDRSEIIGYTTIVLAFLMVYFGVKSYRDSIAGGRVTFGQALKVGLGIAAIAAVCYVAAWEIISPLVAPDFVDRYAAHTVEQLRASGATEAEVAERAREMAEFRELYRNPLARVALGLLEPLPIALLFTLLSAWVLSRKRRTAQV